MPRSAGQENVVRILLVKALCKLIVTSTTYRQDSAATAEKLEVDPDNRLLSRGPRGRLPAEAIRLNTPVRIAEADRGLFLMDGSQLQSKAVVVAAEGPTTVRKVRPNEAQY